MFSSSAPHLQWVRSSDPHLQWVRPLINSSPQERLDPLLIHPPQEGLDPLLIHRPQEGLDPLLIPLPPPPVFWNRNKSLTCVVVCVVNRASFRVHECQTRHKIKTKNTT